MFPTTLTVTFCSVGATAFLVLVLMVWKVRPELYIQNQGTPPPDPDHAK